MGAMGYVPGSHKFEIETFANIFTADGFDLYLCDSPNGAADYAITLAIPRRGRR